MANTFYQAHLHLSLARSHPVSHAFSQDWVANYRDICSPELHHVSDNKQLEDKSDFSFRGLQLWQM